MLGNISICTLGLDNSSTSKVGGELLCKDSDVILEEDIGVLDRKGNHIYSNYVLATPYNNVSLIHNKQEGNVIYYIKGDTDIALDSRAKYTNSRIVGIIDKNDKITLYIKDRACRFLSMEESYEFLDTYKFNKEV